MASVPWGLASAVLLALATGHAQDDSADRVTEVLLGIRSEDPLEFSRAARLLGDQEILEALSRGVEALEARGQEQDLGGLFVVVSATPHLAGPELALPALAKIAASRDPDLAPHAARALYAIARSLDGDALGAREHDCEPPSDARNRLVSMVAQTWVRADVRFLAADTVAMLSAICGESGEE